MESHKTKILKMMRKIYDIKLGDVVDVTDNYDEIFIFRCECYNNNYDLYDINNKHKSWGMSCDTLEDLQDSLAKDFLDGLITNIDFNNK